MKENYVITGTSRGIGLEMTRQLLEAGHTVYALARSPEKSTELMKLKEKYPETLKPFKVDVTADDQVAGFASNLSSGTTIDVLINNAGVYGETTNFENLSLEIVEKTFSNNAVAPMRVTRALLPFLKKSKSPRVINITSLMGSITDNSGGGSYAYRMSKAALNMFHKSFSVDFPRITSLVLHPGWVKTDMGGSSAPVEVRDSAKGILSIVADAKLKSSGKFLDFESDELPW